MVTHQLSSETPAATRKLAEKLIEKIKSGWKLSGKSKEELVVEVEKALGRAENLGNVGDNLIKSVAGDIRKFSEYALTNPSKKGLFVDSWGYKLADAENLLAIYKDQAIQAVKDGKVIANGVDGFGNQLCKIETILNTPLKGKIKVYAGWIIKPNKIDEIILSTPFDGFVN